MLNRKKTKSLLLILLAVLLCAVMLPGCGEEKKAEIWSLDDLKNGSYVIAMATDLGLEDTVKELCPQAEIVYLENLESVESLKNGQVDAVVVGETELNNIVKANADIGMYMVEEPVYTYYVCLGLSKNTGIENYEEKVNECIRRFKEDGTLDEMKSRWSGDNPVKAEIKLPENPEYTLKVGTYGLIKPYTYYENNELTGLDVELAERIAAELGWGIEWERADFAALLAGLDVGKYDMVASNLFYTEGREDAVSYSESYLEEHVCLATVHEQTDSGFNSLEDLANAKSFATVTGSIYPDMLKKLYPDAEIQEFNSLMDAVIAVQNGKADAAVYDEPMISHIAEVNSDLKRIPENLMNEDYYLCTSKTEEGIALAADFNLWLSEFKSSGSLAELKAFWLSNESEEGRCDLSELTGENGTLVVGMAPTTRPEIYLYNGTYVGLPFDVVYHYCKDRGLKIETQVMDFGAFPAALMSEKIDMFLSFISYTDERAENLTFTDTFYDGGVAVLVRESVTEESASVFSNLVEGFEKTFVRESRWKMILSGLGLTLLITLGSFVLANLLGALACWFNMSGSRVLRVIADVYSRIMQGTPMVVVLMILYYVILGKTKLSGAVVAVIGFGLVTGAGLAQVFEGGIRSVDRGQTEASLALGFSKAEAFRGIVFPQAARVALPGYFSELIALLKGTSIVGYIAVVDLTKASDIIRASTYEAFFPLISIAIIYFVIINILLTVMKLIKKCLEPKRVKAKEAAK